MIDVARAFWDGFTRPRLSALAGIFFVVLIHAVVLSPRFLAHVDTPYLMVGPNDYGGQLTSIVMRLHESRPDGKVPVFHVGGSFSQEAIDDPNAVSGELSQALGRPVHYWALHLPETSLWAAGALIEQIPAGAGGFLVVEVNPGMIGNRRDEPKRFRNRSEAVIDSPFLDQEFRKSGLSLPRRTGIPLIDHTGFFSARRENLWRWILHRPRPWLAIHRFDVETSRPVQEGGPLDLVAGTYAERAPLNAALLERIVKLAESRGLKVILMKASLRPVSLARFPIIKPTFERTVADVSKKLGLPVIDPIASAQITDDDWRDPYHLWNSAARRRFQAAFVSQVRLEISKAEARDAR